MWFFHRAPLWARRALYPLYHRLRFFKARVVLRWQWWRSRRTFDMARKFLALWYNTRNRTLVSFPPREP
ncbi:MAG: hypothetical protein B6D41_07875 [Chloroflexi bacterium UTCFX4]|jgi:hypothetical protein|nr:MAG: hypothetical protein B6D41_07875 [Chloroflexi bacterium UTCFX4]